MPYVRISEDLTIGDVPEDEIKNTQLLAKLHPEADRNAGAAHIGTSGDRVIPWPEFTVDPIEAVERLQEHLEALKLLFTF